MLQANSTVLFQGDSITDAGRSREFDSRLGTGYPDHVNKLLAKENPNLNIKVINRGISGNRAIDLVNRWEKDCIAIKPDYVSILIGVNDTWRKYDSNDETTADLFKERLKKIVEDTLAKTTAQIILLNPFLLDVNETVIRMREDLCFKQKAVFEVSKEYGTRFLDLDAVFAEAVKKTAPDVFSADGVHPTQEGHAIIAAEWLKVWQ